MCGELKEILTFIEQLSEVDVQGVPPNRRNWRT
ncbi:aspartyl-tRNA(Asn)/glutamyl-tRNA(Gln) amidotransferase subunit C [Rhizobium sp. 57MFTsu3.2]|nr:aspartyl-tRNA(Asn)/glutamyl-tRNA(Gln) amidotransferase subunit C [Rhizobium sp. 57MFTsu3.2]